MDYRPGTASKPITRDQYSPKATHNTPKLLKLRETISRTPELCPTSQGTRSKHLHTKLLQTLDLKSTLDSGHLQSPKSSNSKDLKLISRSQWLSQEGAKRASFGGLFSTLDSQPSQQRVRAEGRIFGQTCLDFRLFYNTMGASQALSSVNQY